MQTKDTKYANLLIGSGVGLQKDEYLIIEAPIETADFVKELTKVAFEKGAKDVIVYYNDPLFDKIRLENVDAETISEVKDYEKQSLQYYLNLGASSILIESAYPYLYQDIDQNKTAALQNHRNDKRNVIRKAIATKGNKWLIAVYPNKTWAKVLYPELDENKALETMKELLYDICLIDENDPNKNWHDHLLKTNKRAEKLDELNLDHLHFKNKLGTDLTIGLNPDSTFSQGDTILDWCPNIPTEEIATTPDKYRVDGTVVSTKPLVVAGAIIEDFGFTFKDGKVIDYFAGKNKEVLKSLLDADEGAKYLGEVAMVAYHTPISLSNKIFYTTLLDENASCHLALGKGFFKAKGEDALNPELWEKAHYNFSKIHIDFMFGSEDMDIIGIDKQGNEYQIFKNGDFVI